MLPAGRPVAQCNRKLDVVMLIDGSGSLGEKGWKAEIKAAKLFVDAFKGRLPTCISLKSHHGKYMVAEADGKLNANRDGIGAWETFTVIANQDGTISLKTFHGKYVTAGQDGSMNANKGSVGNEEKFTVIHQGAEKIALRAHSGKHAVAEWNGKMNANRVWIRAWERFKFTSCSAESIEIPGTSNANVAVILYSGPRTWSGVFKCFDPRIKSDLANDCQIKTISHFTEDMSAIEKKIDEMKWPKGSTLTSLALQQAKAELSLGRRDAMDNVVVFTDGRPLSYRKTYFASKNLRKSSRLVWVPVTKNAPLKWIKSWATRRWQENVVAVPSFEALEKPDPITHVIADICPSLQPTMEFGRGASLQ
jgi:hypothetical protein